MAEKTYINGLFIKKKRFENGGNVINISINSTTFIEELLKYKNEKGYVNITLQDRREADKHTNKAFVLVVLRCLDARLPHGNDISPANPAIHVLAKLGVHVVLRHVQLVLLATLPCVNAMQLRLLVGTPS